MKNFSISVIILLIAFSCEDAPENIEHELSVLPTLISREGNTYQESVNAWNEMKSINGDAYIYQTTFTSWTGHGSTTEIRVDAGVVTTRIYQAFEINQSNGEKKITHSYHEDGDDVGTNVRGSEPLTIDELYETCASEYLVVDTVNNTVYFQTTTEGLMTICGFVPDGCMDDCYNGIRIHAFAWQN